MYSRIAAGVPSRTWGSTVRCPTSILVQRLTPKCLNMIWAPTLCLVLGGYPFVSIDQHLIWTSRLRNGLRFKVTITVRSKPSKLLYLEAIWKRTGKWASGIVYLKCNWLHVAKLYLSAHWIYGLIRNAIELEVIRWAEEKLNGIVGDDEVEPQENRLIRRKFRWSDKKSLWSSSNVYGEVGVIR